MAKSSDNIRAERLLQARESGGYTLLTFLRTNEKMYLRLIFWYGIPLVILALVPIWPVFDLIVGIVVGTLVRDLGWLTGFQRA